MGGQHCEMSLSPTALLELDTVSLVIRMASYWVDMRFSLTQLGPVFPQQINLPLI